MIGTGSEIVELMFRCEEAERTLISSSIQVLVVLFGRVVSRIVGAWFAVASIGTDW